MQTAYEAILKRTRERNLERGAARRKACEEVYEAWVTQRARAKADAERAQQQQQAGGPARYFTVAGCLIYHTDAHCPKLGQGGDVSTRTLTDSIRPPAHEPCSYCVRAKTDRAAGARDLLSGPRPSPKLLALKE